MPRFRYIATGTDGQRVEGTSHAADWQDVDRALRKRGFKLTGIAEISDPIATNVIPSPSATSIATPTVKPSAPSPVQRSVSPTAVVRTRFSTDRDGYFLFNQVSSYLKAGVNPAQAFDNLARSMSSSKYAAALPTLSAAAAEGRSVAEAMTRYPYLFPPHVVGAFRVGEIGGFLPEAAAMVAEQALASHKFKRWFFWLGICFVSFLATFPVLDWGVKAILGLWDRADATGGSVDGFKLLRESMAAELMRALPWSLAYAAILTVAYIAWKAMPFRYARHRLALIVPTIGKRAKVESMSAFSWSLHHLFRAGMAPKTAVELAADAMPNLSLAERMRQGAAEMSPETKLSEVAGRMSMLTPEMQSIVQTGEYVGDLPGALKNVAEAQKGEFATVDQLSKSKIGCWILLVVLAGSCLAGGLFYSRFYGGLFERVLDDGVQNALLGETDARDALR